MSELSTTDSPSATGLALVVGTQERRRHAVPAVEASGAIPVEVDDPYIAMAELSRGRGAFSSIVLSLHGVYREELQVIAAIRRRFPHVDVWLTDLDGRSAALAEAMRLGADGLLGEEGMHRLAVRAKADTAPQTIAAELAINRVAPARSQEVNGNGRPLPRLETAISDRPRNEPDREAPSTEPRRIAPDRSAEPFREPDGSSVGSSMGAGSSLGLKEGATGAAPSDEVEDSCAFSPGEPILTAEELRALLHDQPDPAPTGRQD